jgi:hypothetical protein
LSALAGTLAGGGENPERQHVLLYGWQQVLLLLALTLLRPRMCGQNLYHCACLRH